MPNESASTLEWALWWAEQGFHIFPLVPNSKLPLIEGWQRRATTDSRQINKWWVCPVLGFNHDYNVGISTSRFRNASEALWVIDVDNKGTKRGDNEILRLEMEGHEIPPTLEQITPTGGRHIIYVVDEATPNSAGRLAPGLDIRSRGGFIVGAGSTTEHGRYSIRAPGCGPARAPAWYRSVGSAQNDNRPASRAGAPILVDQNRAVLRAVDYLKRGAPHAIEGNGGDATTYAVAARVKDFGVDPETAVALLLEHWNNRCQPPWQADDLERKVRNAYSYGKEAQGSDSPEAAFAPAREAESPGQAAASEHRSGDAESVASARGKGGDGLKAVELSNESSGQSTGGYAQPGRVESVLPPLHKINKDHALIYIEGSHFVLNETIDEKGRPHRIFLSEASFKRKFSPYTTQRSTKGKPVTWAEEWLDWSGRREYRGLCFAPEREPRNGYYNLWRGFACTPLPYEEASTEAKRGFDAWHEHLRNNVCRGNAPLLTWLLTYFAHMIQRPWERPLTTLVLRGLKGVGKNAPIDRVGYLLGSRHYLVAHDSRYLTSNFNGHLDSCLCLVLDEAFWSGDKNAEGKLKGITTAPELLIERKSKEPYQIDNLVRLIVIGNEDWLVPASADERRYAVFDVTEGRKQDTKFFEQMRVDIDERGGNRVLLAFLRHFDLSHADINVVPKTAALLDQKHASLEPFEQWWLDCLMSGRIVGSDFGGEWPDKIETDRFRSAFRRYATERNVRARIPGDISLGRLLKRIAPGIRKGRERQGQDLLYVYFVPSLTECREAWGKFIGHESTIEWESVDVKP